MELLQLIGFYFDLPQKDAVILADLFQEEKLEKNDYFLKEGQYSQKLSFIKEGFIRVIGHHEGREITQFVSSAGYFACDIACLAFNQAARFDLQALSDCSLYSIKESNYRKLPNLLPKWHLIEKLFIAKCFMALEQRVFQLISLSAKERYALLFEQQPELFNQIPLQYLASLLGMTPETLSRMRKSK